MLTKGFELSAVLSSILEAISLPENAAKLGEAKDNAGNDMLKMMQFVFPIVMQIEMDVIKSYGFPEGREGTVRQVEPLCNVYSTISEVCTCWNRLVLKQ